MSETITNKDQPKQTTKTTRTTKHPVQLEQFEIS